MRKQIFIVNNVGTISYGKVVYWSSFSTTIFFEHPDGVKPLIYEIQFLDSVLITENSYVTFHLILQHIQNKGWNRFMPFPRKMKLKTWFLDSAFTVDNIYATSHLTLQHLRTERRNGFMPFPRVLEVNKMKFNRNTNFSSFSLLTALMLSHTLFYNIYGMKGRMGSCLSLEFQK